MSKSDTEEAEKRAFSFVRFSALSSPYVVAVELVLVVLRAAMRAAF